MTHLKRVARDCRAGCSWALGRVQAYDSVNSPRFLSRLLCSIVKFCRVVSREREKIRKKRECRENARTVTPFVDTALVDAMFTLDHVLEKKRNFV